MLTRRMIAEVDAMAVEHVADVATMIDVSTSEQDRAAAATRVNARSHPQAFPIWFGVAWKAPDGQMATISLSRWRTTFTAAIPATGSAWLALHGAVVASLKHNRRVQVARHAAKLAAIDQQIADAGVPGSATDDQVALPFAAPGGRV